MVSHGIYFLLLRLDTAQRMRIGARSGDFPQGYYIYIGSAQGMLAQRIARHRRTHKKLKWHIDFFLQYARVIAVRVLPNAPKQREAQMAMALCCNADSIPMRKFGASDSPAVSHLVGFQTRRRAEEVLRNVLTRATRARPARTP
jgi:sugar fermentation stimulation protein A